MENRRTQEVLDLAGIEARADAATSGPWEVVVELDGVMAGRKTAIKASDGFTRRRVVTVDQTRAHHRDNAESNVEFIAAARGDVPALLARLRELVAERGDHIRLLGEFVSPDDDCWFDHHGGCQAHGYLDLKPGQKCPHAEVKTILAQPGYGEGVR